MAYVGFMARWDDVATAITDTWDLNLQKKEAEWRASWASVREARHKLSTAYDELVLLAPVTVLDCADELREVEQTMTAAVRERGDWRPFQDQVYGARRKLLSAMRTDLTS
jgi:hypothetical protein